MEFRVKRVSTKMIIFSVLILWIPILSQTVLANGPRRYVGPRVHKPTLFNQNMLQEIYGGVSVESAENKKLSQADAERLLSDLKTKGFALKQIRTRPFGLTGISAWYVYFEQPVPKQYFSSPEMNAEADRILKAHESKDVGNELAMWLLQHYGAIFGNLKSPGKMALSLISANLDLAATAAPDELTWFQAFHQCGAFGIDFGVAASGGLALTPLGIAGLVGLANSAVDCAKSVGNLLDHLTGAQTQLNKKRAEIEEQRRREAELAKAGRSGYGTTDRSGMGHNPRGNGGGGDPCVGRQRFIPEHCFER